MAKELTARLWGRANRDWQRYRFERVVSGVHRLPPLQRGAAPLTLLSMVQPRDVAPYLLALRSLYRSVPARRVVVVCDPKMSGSDVETIRRSVPFVETHKAESFRDAAFPVGGCWERLAAIAHISRDDYVVQLDADTVALRSLDEVARAAAEERAFVIGEEPGQHIVTCQQASATAAEYLSRVADRHIQAWAERELVNATEPGRFYVRGCAGFTGFPRNGMMLEHMREFSLAMRARLNERWGEWGTEQVASNFLAANLPGAFVLPFPAYATPDVTTPQTRFLHFIGSLRFESGAYARAARSVIAELAPH
jgi:hypothetical protein